MASVTWQCPQCGRRVPNRAEECHCGMTKRAALTAAQSPVPGSVAGAASSGPRAPVPSLHRFSWRGLPRELKLMAVGLAVVLLLGLGWVFMVPYRPQPIVPLLGWSEPTSPRPRPTPSPSPRGSGQPKPEKKGWLPW
jgi:hypothetical protein